MSIGVTPNEEQFRTLSEPKYGSLIFCPLAAFQGELGSETGLKCDCSAPASPKWTNSVLRLFAWVIRLSICPRQIPGHLSKAPNQINKNSTF